jgi:dienelactone hydrolase
MAMEGKINDAATLQTAISLAWDEYISSINEPVGVVNGKEVYRKDELAAHKTTHITIGSTTMKVMTKVVGSKPEGGYPMFLIYHGGGYDPDQNTNEGQWAGMADRYAHIPGIYCSIRSVSDFESSGQIFSTDISWKFYDRIIENGIAFMNADPNKIYVVGYSAGGNGVYQIAPRLADRIASANMSAGHPEGISLVNMYNVPFYLQVGELDTSYKRNTITVEYAQKLAALATTYGGGYVHKCFVHFNTVHGRVGDNKSGQTVIADVDAWLKAQTSGGKYTGGNVTAETHAAKLMTQHTRNPIPERVIWDISTTARSNKCREVSSFYWLSTNAQSGEVDISYNKSTNTVTVKASKVNGDLTIYLNEDMVDLFSEVTVVLPDGSTKKFMPKISVETIRKTIAERGDPNYIFCAEYTIDM